MAFLESEENSFQIMAEKKHMDILALSKVSVHPLESLWQRGSDILS